MRHDMVMYGLHPFSVECIPSVQNNNFFNETETLETNINVQLYYCTSTSSSETTQVFFMSSYNCPAQYSRYTCTYTPYSHSLQSSATKAASTHSNQPSLPAMKSNVTHNYYLRNTFCTLTLPYKYINMNSMTCPSMKTFVYTFTQVMWKGIALERVSLFNHYVEITPGRTMSFKKHTL